MLAAAGSVQDGLSRSGRAEVSHQLAAAEAQHGSSCSTGQIVVSHDLAVAATLQRNLSLRSGITCIQDLLALNASQINLSPTVSIAGRVTLFRAPPGQTFRFVAQPTTGSQETWD